MAKKILIVDDKMEYVMFLPDILEEYGYSVTIVDSGFKAIKLVKEIYFDVVISDIQMPGINGVETFKEIKKISPTTAVIMMTAYDDEEMLRETIKEGSFAFFYKPIDMNKLIKTISDAIERPIIIVVDDKFEDREVVCNVLEQKGYKTVSVESGEQAIEIFKRGKADIAFIGVKMSGVNGFTTLEKVKKLSPEVGVIMMTAYEQQKYMKKALELGAFTCLHKPLRMDVIIKTVEKIKKEKIKKRAKRVLLVEDDENLAKTITLILEEEGYFVDWVKDGGQAIKKSKEGYYSNSIVDYKLPDMNGIEVVKKIKKINPKINIIFVSGYATLDIAVKALREHVSDFFSKPVDPDVLIRSLRKNESRLQ